MLYVTTRNRWDTYTAQWALTKDTGPDGGLFVPMGFPQYDAAQIRTLADQSLYTTVAQVLNQFFSAKLTEQDVRFAVGPTTVNLVTMSHRLVVAETWHNPAGEFSGTALKLCRRMCQPGTTVETVSDWANIAVQIAFLFGIFGQLLHMGVVDLEKPVDVAVTAGDFSSPMAVWYARKMGLPIHVVVCGCNENGAPWELLHKGEFRTGVVAVKTTTPLADYARPAGLERLISAALGDNAVQAYVSACDKGAVYVPCEDEYEILRKGMFASVAGNRRLDALVPNVYRTNSYVFGPYSALAYAGLMDYRTITGGNTTAILLAPRSPLLDEQWMLRALDVPSDTLRERVKLS